MALPSFDDNSARRLELFRVLVEEAREYGIFLLDAGGRIVSWNAGAERIKGYHANEVLGRPFSIFYPPEDIARGKPDHDLARAAAQGRAEDEGWRVRKDGSRYWAGVVITALRDASGALIGFSKLSRDLTEQERTREALRRKEEDLAVTLRSVGDALIATDEHGRVTIMNPVAEQLTGWSASEAMGRPLDEVFRIVHERTREPVESPSARVLREGRIVGLGNHTLLVRRDGTETPIADSASPIQYRDGSVRGVVLIFRDQTAERAAEQAIRDSEERLSLLVEGVTEYAIFMLDPRGYIVSWNLGAQRIKGYTAAEILGQHITRFYGPEDVAAEIPRRLLEEAAHSGKAEADGWRVRKDGTRFWANVVITALRDSTTGQLRGFAKVTRDLTERRQAEAKQRALYAEQAARAAAEALSARLRESEERHRTVSERLGVILEGVSDGITMQDRSLRIIYANSQAARTCGYDSQEAMRAAPLSDFAARFALFDSADRPLTLDQLPSRRVLDGEDPSAALVHVREKASGRDWWSFIQSRGVHDATGAVDAVVSIWHDMTSSRRRQDELQFLADTGALLSSTLDYETTLRKLAELIVPRLADWCSVNLVEGSEVRSLAVAHADPAKVALAREWQVKYPPDPKAAGGAHEVVRTGRSLLYPEIPDEILTRGVRDAEHLRVIRELGLKSAMVVPIVARDEPVMGALTLVHAESGRRYDQADLALAEELGRRAALAIESARLYREAREAIHVRDEFLSVAGHELKTPLAALQLQLQSLARGAERGKLADDQARLRERLVKTISLGNRLDRLMKELLEISRITSGRLALERTECDLAALARDVLDRFEEEIAAAGCAIRVHGDDKVVGCWDRGRLDQVITNLLSNALKYGRGKPLDVTVEGAAGAAVLTVRDHGIGIAAEHQARIFGRFERAVSERNYGGFGLGLWIVRQIVEAHGGSVRLHSQAGEGATFVVELPAVPPGEEGGS